MSDRPIKPSDGPTIVQPGADTHEPHLSPSSQTVSQSSAPPSTADDADVNILGIQSSSSSRPAAVNPYPLLSTADNIEQHFIPLVDADRGLYTVMSSDDKDILNQKDADLKESVAENGDRRYPATEDDKVRAEPVAGSESIKQNKDMEFDGDKNEEEDDDKVEGDDTDGDNEDVAADNIHVNVNVDTRNVGVDVSVDEHLGEVKDVIADSDDRNAHDSSQPVHPTSGVDYLSNSAVIMETTLEPDYAGLSKGKHLQPSTWEPALSSGRAEFEQYSGPRSDEDVRQLRSSSVNQPSFSRHIGNDFDQQRADIISHRDYWHKRNQPGDTMFPGEFRPHFDHGAPPSAVWKYVHSSPVEEFRNKWPKMQEAYRSWPDSMREQRYRMNHMADDYHFMQQDEKQFVNHELDKHWLHVNPQDDYYFLSQRDQRSQFSGQSPNVDVHRWPDEATQERVRYGDVFNNQQHHGHSYQNQEPDIRQTNIRVDQVYQQHPLGQRYMSRFDDTAAQSGLADEPVASVRSTEQAVGQMDHTAVGQPQRPLTDKSHVDPRPSSDQWTETDLRFTEQAGDAQYYNDRDMSSSPQKDASRPPSPVVDRSSDPISGV